VAAIDTSTREVVGRFELSRGTYPQALALSPDGGLAYVVTSASSDKSALVVLDTRRMQLVAMVELRANARRVAGTPHGRAVYLVDTGKTPEFLGSISVIDPQTARVTATIQVGTAPSRIAITHDGLFAWVTNSGSNDISVINLTNNTVVASAAAGDRPDAI